MTGTQVGSGKPLGFVEFHLPDIGEGLHEAEVINWLVAVGEPVERNQPFVEIMTDKATVEMPAPVAGIISRLGAPVGEIIQVGDVLVVIETVGSDTPGPPPVAPATAAPPSMVADRASASLAPSVRSTGLEVSGARRPKASPSTRKLAAELGVDLASVQGTGPGGRILADDVQALGRSAAAPAPVLASAPAPAPAPAPVLASAPAPAQRQRRTFDRPSGFLQPNPSGVPAVAQMAAGVHPLRGVRRATAKAMDLSWSTIPHINAMNEINAEHLLSMRAQLRQLQEPEAPNITPLVIALLAVARALRRHPIMNATLDLEAETITVHERVNIGIAVATDYGLMVPVIADADQLGVTAMAAELQRLTLAARSRSTTPADLRGGTHTVTNFGSQGTYVANPIIRPGETGITGLGSIAERPFVVDGAVVARPTLPVVVCGDHRLVDGDVLSSFHNDICDSLQAPLGLLL